MSRKAKRPVTTYAPARFFCRDLCAVVVDYCTLYLAPHYLSELGSISTNRRIDAAVLFYHLYCILRNGIP